MIQVQENLQKVELFDAQKRGPQKQNSQLQDRS